MERGEVYNRFAATSFRSFNEFCEAFLHRCATAILDRLNSGRFSHYERKMRRLCPFYSSNDVKFRFIRNELPQVEFTIIMDEMIEEKGRTLAEIAQNLWLTNADLKNLSLKGHHIGLHSYDHPFALSKLSIQEQSDQYEKNYRHIRKVCGREPQSMSHPLNSYGADTLKVLEKKGIVCGFRSVMTPPRGKRVNPSPLEIAREDPPNILSAL